MGADPPADPHWARSSYGKNGTLAITTWGQLSSQAPPVSQGCRTKSHLSHLSSGRAFRHHFPGKIGRRLERQLLARMVASRSPSHPTRCSRHSYLKKHLSRTLQLHQQGYPGTLQLSLTKPCPVWHGCERCRLPAGLQPHEAPAQKKALRLHFRGLAQLGSQNL